MEVVLSSSASGLTASDLDGFFVGWPNPPTPERRLQIVQSADEAVVARVGGRVVGFATAITDGTFAASIPLVEVLPELQGAGIGSRIVAQLLERLERCYVIDLVCDDDVVPFYERLGGRRLNAVTWRNYAQLQRER